MTYKINVTAYTEKLLDNRVRHLIYSLKNEQTVKRLLDRIDSIYDRLEVNLISVHRVQRGIFC